MAEPALPYAEVIGDPIDHSLSPAIHRHWLKRLGLTATYRRHRCGGSEPESYLDNRRTDPLWRGCNVTMPLKERVAALVSPRGAARRLGAVNCVTRRGEQLVGLNTDVDGVAAALDDAQLTGQRAVLVGAGGAARAALAALAERGAHVTIVTRSPAKARPLHDLAPGLTIAPLDEAAAAVAGAAAIINAAPLGSEGAASMPEQLLAALTAAAPGAVALDMVYRPLLTPFLAAAAAAGLRTADGLAMLIGQARPAFRLFFGVEPPPEDGELRALLVRMLRAG